MAPGSALVVMLSGGTTLSVKDPVADAPETSDTMTVNGKLPMVVGTPVSWPVELLMPIPGGGDPTNAKVKFGGTPPVLPIVKEYGVPATTAGGGVFATDSGPNRTYIV